MEYRITYDSQRGSKRISIRKIRMLSVGLPLLGLLIVAVLLWYDRQNLLAVCVALEEMALHLREGASPADAVAAFCQQLQGSIG